jgi:thiopeptide-type bacteriocin biosynthesis protein
MSGAGRTPTAVDLALDCEVRVPDHVAREVERAASALLLLTRRPAGHPAWRDYRTAVRDRYGAGTLVPLRDLVDSGSGLGYPAGFPASVLSPPAAGLLERDERLLALAWQTIADGTREMVVTDRVLRTLTEGYRVSERAVPAHVELSVRLHAPSTDAVDRGDYQLTVTPASRVGTLTSRFTAVIPDSGLEEIYRAAPAATAGALRAQLSFPPLYPQAENICRVPRYLPDVLSLGEHRDGADGTTISVDDLAVTVVGGQLYLVSLSRRQVVEPQLFHALALERQARPLARFLAHISRAYSASWTEFDWGPQARKLPFLPRLRYRRAILSPARWRLTSDTVSGATDSEGANDALSRWRARWKVPGTVELRDVDRTLRLSLDEPAHLTILRTYLRRDGEALLTEAAAPEALGWISGHAHEIVFPLTSTRPPRPSPRLDTAPIVTNRTHGQFPGSRDSACTYAKVYAHPDLHHEIIINYLPPLVAALGPDCQLWFVRYRGPHETDHLRLRFCGPEGDRWSAHATALGAWAERLRDAGVANHTTFDTYRPEIGRYGGTVEAMDAAETVFATDSLAVAAALRSPTRPSLHPTAMAAINMWDLACGFLGDTAVTARWLVGQGRPAARADGAAAAQVVSVVRGDTTLVMADDLIHARHIRADALAAYRAALPAAVDISPVLESLLHMHHNRAFGVDPESERTCRHLLRQAALAWRAQRADHP